MDSHKYDDDPPAVPPPSYHEAISSPPVQPERPQPPPPRPPPRPPQRPSQAPPQRPPQPPQRPESSSANYSSNNSGLPFLYPSRYLCKRCKNTGYRKGHMCRDCWIKFYIRDHAYNPNRELPFKYPKGFLCEKCENKGIKLKNGKSCKDCYERFAHRNQYQIQQPGSYWGPANIMPFGPRPMAAPMAPGGMPALQVPPGDPRLGGVLCGKCRGTGQVWFLLDSDLCPLCGGLGRILNSM